jgi:hypothetical protein
MPAQIREAVWLRCPICGQTGIANIAYGSERVSASAVKGFVVRIPATRGSLQITCAACKTVVRELSMGDIAAE